MPTSTAGPNAGKRGPSKRAASTKGATSAAKKNTSRSSGKAKLSRREQRRRARVAKMRARAGSRWRIHYDVDGPRVRLGVAWFLGALVAFATGLIGIVVYFGVAFAAAGSHALRTWRARGADVDPTVGLVAVASVVALASFGPRMFGLGILALAGVAVVVTTSGGNPNLARAGLVLQCTLPVALAGGSLVLLADREVWSAIALVLLASGYESGDFLVGSGAANNVEGPVAGAAAVFVLSGVVAGLGFPPFDIGQAMAFGMLVAPLALVGQYLATAVLPHARTFAPALRRVDSYLVAAPVWYFGLDAFVF